MRSPAFAIAWEFRQRHQPALIALVTYVLGFATVRLLTPSGAFPIRLNPPNGVAAAAIVPLSTAFMYFLAVFSFGLDGDVGGRPSLFPRRLFTLPITTRALAGWPMLIGGAAVASLWIFTAPFVQWSWGLDLPMIWPALLGAVFLAWAQVLSWAAYGLPGLRILVAVMWLMALDVMVILAVQLKVPESTLVAMLLPQLPLAYLAACFVVARARQGQVPDWQGRLRSIFTIPRVLSPGSRGFPSPFLAQAWFEWRQQGFVLPALVGLVLPFELSLLYLARHEPPILIELTLIAVSLTPSFMAGFSAAIAGTGGAEAFSATRPLTSARLVGAKLQAAMWSTLLTWLLVLVATPLALVWSGTWPTVASTLTDIVEYVGVPRAVAIGLLALAGLMASTFKQLVQSLCIALTGRAWAVRTAVILRLAFLIVLFPAVDGIVRHGQALALLWDAGPWILGVLAFLKITVAALLVPALRRGRLLTDRALVVAAASWLTVVLALYGVLVWLLFTPPFFPRYLPALAAILLVPLTRIAAAPLALAWNRHRGTANDLDASQPSAPGRTVGVVRALIALPLALLLFETAAFAMRTRNNGVLISSGEKREYLLHVPKAYDPAKPTPLVISMHGAALWPSAQRDVSAWDALSDREGFIVVYPGGLSGHGPRHWLTGPSGVAKETRFISDLIDTLGATHNIDSTRVYADGLSNGGGMAFVLSCTLGDRIAAVGLVASAQLLPFDWCPDRRAVPMIAVHGTGDRLAPYEGGKSPVARDPFPSIPAFVENWARRNHCGPDPTDTAVARDVNRREYTHCGNHAAVVLLTVRGGGHQWPGRGVMPEWMAGAMNGSVDATKEIWDFYREHPLRQE